MPRPDPREHPAMKGNIWKKGQSGNPKGRPKGTATLQGRVLRLLDEEIKTSGGVEGDRLEIIARVILDECIQKRNTKMIALILDRLWPKTQIISLEEGSELKVRHSAPLEELVETLRLVEEITGHASSDEDPE